MTFQSVLASSEIRTYASTTPNIRKPRGGDVLAFGFAITVAIWLTAYVGRLPMVELPAHVTVAAMLAVILLGGFLAARTSPNGLRAAVGAGALSGLLDLILISSLYHDLKPADLSTAPSIALWIAGSIALNTLFATLGGLLGSFRAATVRERLPLHAHPPLPHGRGSEREYAAPIAWASLFAFVLVSATFLLIAAGGFVTANRAGLAVPDWPRSFGYNMFLFPLSLMQKDSGQFFEHAHRLMGSLVGVTAISLAVYISVTDRRPAVLILAWAIVVGVSIQGLMGGLRVTDKSETLAIIHGAFAQIVFAAMATLIAVTSRRFLTLSRHETRVVSTDRTLTAALVVSLLGQLVLGTIVRHTSNLVLLHITMAALVTSLTLACGFRAWGLYGNIRPFRTLGLALLAVVALQLALGILALIFWNGSTGTITTTSVLLTTAHQINGALLLALAAALTAWTWHILTPPTETASV
jgi:cytochrome c oxidase assembly protein subunit 15